MAMMINFLKKDSGKLLLTKSDAAWLCDLAQTILPSELVSASIKCCDWVIQLAGALLLLAV